jgi:hypothetical protein
VDPEEVMVMAALRYGAVIAVVVAGLIAGFLLGVADPAHPAPRAQSYCLDQSLADAEPKRWPGAEGCHPLPSQQWLDTPGDLQPVSQDVRFN